MKNVDPQVEDGFTRISNELVEAWIKILPADQAIFLAVIRETYGFNRKSSTISTERFRQLTGIIDRRHIHRAITQSISKRMISVIKSDDKTNPTYSIIKKYNKWKVSSNMMTSSNLMTSVIKSDDALYVKDTIKDIKIEGTSPSGPPPAPPPETQKLEDPVPYAEIYKAWNEAFEDEEVAEAIFKLMSPSRKAAIRARWNISEKTQNLEFWKKQFIEMSESKFLMGKTKPILGKKPFKLNMGWVFKAENFAKIMEGNYDEKD